jgi:carbon starvation protein
MAPQGAFFLGVTQMNASIVVLVILIFFLLAYRFYASHLEKNIFAIEELEEQTPAHEHYDGIDYVPSKRQVLIGHHFSSIAGAAPIVGPAVAAIWGWLPAVLWVVFGVIFMGAAHDFGALVVSMKNKGGSIGEVANKLLGPRAKILFLTIIFFLVWMVIAVFALVIANLFIKFPSSVIPVNFEIIIAVIMGIFINKKNKSLTIPSILAQLGLFVMIYIGTKYPIALSTYFGESELMVWIIFLLIYSFIASTLPVWMLLQPRDYINSHQLFLGLGLMIIGLFVVSPKIVAPAFNPSPVGAPDWFPFLFITIACGAISGFHGLVSGGTSSKQVSTWKDAKPIGYGSMLGEGLLAILATLAVTTGFADEHAWHSHYATWEAANGLGAKISAFVLGAGKFVSGIGISEDISHTVIAVLIISFAATSLDTACRIQRYIIAEFGEVLNVKPLTNKYVGSGIATLSAFALMMSNDGGKGGLYLWPLFGATNQMLAGLTLTTIALYLAKNKKPSINYVLPAVFIFSVTSFGLYKNINFFQAQKNLMLVSIAVILFLSQVWIIIESTLAFIKQRK